MRAMVLPKQAPVETRPLELRGVEVPEPGPDEVLVRVRACGVCRTDLHVVEGDLPALRMPLVPGHQTVGVVERVGAAVTRVRRGERVGIAWLRRTCGACAFCRSGRENLCERAEFSGYSADGGYAEFATAPESFVYALPAVFGDVEAAPLLCAGIIGYRALSLAAVPPGGRLGLYGFGSSAHVTLQVARARGCEVYVATRRPSHRALARDLGAVWAGSLEEPPPARMHASIVFAPAGTVVPLALRGLARGGTVVLAGVTMTPVPSLEYADLFHERIVRTVTANTRADGDGMLAEAARIPVRLATTVFPLEDANEALDALKRGAFAGSGVLTV